MTTPDAVSPELISRLAALFKEHGTLTFSQILSHQIYTLNEYDRALNALIADGTITSVAPQVWAHATITQQPTVFRPATLMILGHLTEHRQTTRRKLAKQFPTLSKQNIDDAIDELFYAQVIELTYFGEPYKRSESTEIIHFSSTIESDDRHARRREGER